VIAPSSAGPNFTVVATKRYRRDLRRLRKSGADLHKLEAVVQALASGRRLSPQHQDHALTGNFAEFRECHVAPDWLLIYERSEASLVLALIRTGSHSQLRLE
jgi:mRNA interferase YafQ